MQQKPLLPPESKEKTSKPTRRTPSPPKTEPSTISSPLVRNMPICIAVYVVVLVLYSVLGMFMFFALEHKSEATGSTSARACADVTRSVFRDFEVAQDMDNDNDTSPWERAELALNKSLAAIQDCLENYTIDSARIDSYFDSMMYAITIYTTLGYGHIVALTTLGRLATMVYAIAGIPLYTAFVGDLGICLGTIMFNTITSVRDYFYAEPDDDPSRLRTQGRFFAMVASAATTFVVTTVLIHICEALVFNRWTIIDAMHYCFSTVTLIGFGDMSVSEDYLTLLYLPFFVVCQTLYAVVFYFMQHWLRYDLYMIATRAMGFNSGNANEESPQDEQSNIFPGTGNLCIDIAEKDAKRTPTPVSVRSFQTPESKNQEIYLYVFTGFRVQMGPITRAWTTVPAGRLLVDSDLGGSWSSKLAPLALIRNDDI